MSVEEFFRQMMSGDSKKLLLLVLVLFVVGCLLLAVNIAVRFLSRVEVSVRPMFTYSERNYSISVGNISHYGCMALISIVMAVAVLAAGSPVSFGRHWYEKHQLIAHAGGGIDGLAYTNSIEAVKLNYKNGHRVFEVDFCLSGDMKLVAEHDWKYFWQKQKIDSEAPVTRDEFMSTPVYEKYTPMDIDTVIDLMIEYEDMYVMTDYKNCNNKQEVQIGLKQIVVAAEKKNAKRVLKRFIIQTYHDSYIDWANEVYTFDNYVYTMYVRGDYDFDKFVGYCRSAHVPIITMWTEWYYNLVLGFDDYKDLNVFVHTENEISYVRQLIADGVKGIYTDFITPEMI